MYLIPLHGLEAAGALSYNKGNWANFISSLGLGKSGVQCSVVHLPGYPNAKSKDTTPSISVLTFSRDLPRLNFFFTEILLLFYDYILTLVLSIISLQASWHNIRISSNTDGGRKELLDFTLGFELWLNALSFNFQLRGCWACINSIQQYLLLLHLLNVRDISLANASFSICCMTVYQVKMFTVASVQ